MIYYVDAKAFRDGDGSKERPFKHIGDAAADHKDDLCIRIQLRYIIQPLRNQFRSALYHIFFIYHSACLPEIIRLLQHTGSQRTPVTTHDRMLQNRPVPDAGQSTRRTDQGASAHRFHRFRNLHILVYISLEAQVLLSSVRSG